MEQLKTHEEADPTTRLFRALLRTFNHLKQTTEPFFSKYGISGPQWGVLRTLHRAHANGDKSLQLKDLGKRLLIRPPSVTGVVDRLERMGLVKRTASTTDLRVRELCLTAQGRRLVTRVLKRHPAYVKSLFDTLAMGEQEHMLGLLERLDTHLCTLAGDRGNEATDDSTAT